MGKHIKPEQRAQALSAMRELKMARSTHAYVRGNTPKFYDWLAQSPVAAALPVGPAIWICGDCHLGNLGPLADADARVDIQIRDLDQAVIGNPAYDLVRLALSLQTAARGSDLPGVVSARMVEAMADGYEQAFASASDTMTEPDIVGTVRKRALGRRWKQLARERIGDAEPTIPLGKKYWPISKEERAGIAALVATPEVRALALTSFQSAANSEVRIHDAAYWRKGCSSLGLLRFAVLIGVTDQDGEETFSLIDIKEAVASVAPKAPKAQMPRQPAERVVAGARALSPHLGDRMVAARLLDKSVIVRELLPQDLKIEIEQFSRAEAIGAARYLAHVVGKAHARQMDETVRAAWHRTLTKGHARSIDAPVLAVERRRRAGIDA
jgi:uncharacterized protein (DUF2252 family)